MENEEVKYIPNTNDPRSPSGFTEDPASKLQRDIQLAESIEEPEGSLDQTKRKLN